MAGETSADPIQYTLPRVIERTGRVLISNGDLDMIILTNGTLLAIQNMVSAVCVLSASQVVRRVPAA